MRGDRGVGGFFERERGRGKSTTYERHNIIFFIFFLQLTWGLSCWKESGGRGHVVPQHQSSSEDVQRSLKESICIKTGKSNKEVNLISNYRRSSGGRGRGRDGLWT